MKETLYTRHRNTVEPMMIKNNRKATLQALHTVAVVKAVRCHERNMVLDGRPPPISNSEKELTRKERSTVAQLRSGYCRFLGSYKSRIKKDASLDVCAECGTTPHDVKHLFVCPAHPTTLIPSDLWNKQFELSLTYTAGSVSLWCMWSSLVCLVGCHDTLCGCGG